MRPRITIAALTLTLAGAFGSPARADDDYGHGWLRFVEPGASLQRAQAVAAEEADSNEPFLPGDRVWTNADGRVEFQFTDGSLLRLDRRSKLDYSGQEEQDGQQIFLRLWSGSVYLRTRGRNARFEIETPAGVVRSLERSLVRVDVDAGEARVSVYEGEAVFDDGRAQLRLAGGERTYARFGGGAEEPRRFDLDEQDDFALWNAELDTQVRGDGRSAAYLPDDLDYEAGELDSYGDWRYEATIGYVWVPRVEVGWRPYWHGRWCWTPYGWTWVPAERWGWVPSHYGRWGHGSFGWYWIPGRTWGPAWVSWALGDGYVGWCPLGWRDQPVEAWKAHAQRSTSGGRHATPRSGSVGADAVEAWSVVPRADLASHDLMRLEVAASRVDATMMHSAESALLRPTRDLASLREGALSKGVISTRPTPGDFVPELAVDNKTLPAPWFRGGSTPRDMGSIRSQDGRTAGTSAKPGMRSAGEATSGAPSPSQSRANELRSFRRAPESRPQQTARPANGRTAEPRERNVTSERPASPPAQRAQREAPRSQSRVLGGGETRSSGASTSPQRNAGQNSPRPSGEAAGARPRTEPHPAGDAMRPSPGPAKSGSAKAQGRDRK